MKAIILAAGMGNRLKPLTNDIPKCMVKLCEKSLLEWQIQAFQDCNIDDISVVTGYQSETINFPNITYFNNPEFELTNMNESLFCAKAKLDDSVIISYSDIVYNKKIIEEMLDFKGDFGIAVNSMWRESYIGRTEHPFSEAENALIENDLVIEIKKNITKSTQTQILSEFLGILILSKKGSEIILEKFTHLSRSHQGKFHSAESLRKAYLTDMIQELIDSGHQITPIFVKGKWCEVDTSQDLKRAKKLFC